MLTNWKISKKRVFTHRSATLTWIIKFNFWHITFETNVQFEFRTIKVRIPSRLIWTLFDEQGFDKRLRKSSQNHLFAWINILETKHQNTYFLGSGLVQEFFSTSSYLLYFLNSDSIGLSNKFVYFIFLFHLF